MNSIDWNAFLENVMGDETLASDVAAAFLQETPQLQETLRVAVSAQDAPTAQRAAHTLKSNCRMFAAPAEETAKAVEQAIHASDWNACQTRCQQLNEELSTLQAELRERFQL